MSGFSGLVFVACMFIGAGIGLLFNRPDVGGAIGMGVGFLAMGLIRVKGVKPSPVTIGLPESFGQVALIVLGALMIADGAMVMYDPKLLYPYAVGITVIIIGLLVLVAGLIKRKSEKQAPTT